MTTDKPSQKRHRSEPDVYEIRVQGRLSDTLVSELEAVRQTDSDTTLMVEVPDRAGLQAFMTRVADLGLKVISINPGRADDKPRETR